MNKKIKNSIIIILISSLIGSFFYFDLGSYLTFESIKENQLRFSEYYSHNQLLTITIFFLIYILSTALSLPGASLLTLLGGALFGLVLGTIIISFASTIGATFAFLSSRYLLRDYIQEKFSKKLKPINDGIDKEGGFYLFSLRLVPAFPFFLVNLIMGVTSIKLLTYFFVSQLGMLPGTIIYTNAGTQLSQLHAYEEIFSPAIISSFIVLGLFPIISKKTLEFFKK